VKTFAELPLTVKSNPRARRVLVKLMPGQGLEIVTPPGFPVHLLDGILEDKRRWIERSRDQMLAKGIDLSGAPPSLPETMEFRAVDRCFPVFYLDRQGRPNVMENGGRLMVTGPADDSCELLRTLQEYTVKKAREILLPWLNVVSRKTGLDYAALRVRRQRTRWGSCSARGTISLNAKLLFLPPELVEHLLLHELCHTRHLNHSKAYWACVAGFQPEYKRFERAVTNAGHYVPAWFA